MSNKFTNATLTAAPSVNTNLYVDDSDGALKYTRSDGTVTAISNSDVNGMPIEDWVKDTFVKTSVKSICAVLKVAKFDIDKEQSLIMYMPQNFCYTSGQNVINSVNKWLPDTGMPIRLVNIESFNKVTQSNGNWKCEEFINLKLRHIEIKDL